MKSDGGCERNNCGIVNVAAEAKEIGADLSWGPVGGRLIPVARVCVGGDEMAK